MEGVASLGADRRPSSILLADVGTVITKAVLLTADAGRCQIAAEGRAPTTLDPPWADLTLGLRDAINQVAVETGREFFDGDGEMLVSADGRGRGAGLFSAAISAAPPLRVVICGLSRDLSAASAVRATLGTYSFPVKTLSVEEFGSVWYAADWAREIADARPDVVVVAGGTDNGGLLPMLQLVLTALSACGPANTPSCATLLYVGNPEARGAIETLATGPVDVRFASNVCPQIGMEQLAGLGDALDALYLERQVARMPGADRLRRWCSCGPAPASSAYGRMIEYMGAVDDASSGVLGIDVGAAHTVVASARDGHTSLAVSHRGVALTGEALRDGDLREISRWLPEPLPHSRLRDLLVARQERPAATPRGADALWVDQALARESLRLGLREALPASSTTGKRGGDGALPFYATIVAGGAALSGCPRPGQAALIVLDGVQPTGIVRLVLDAHSLLTGLGSIAAEAPLAVVEALAAEGLVDLGTVIAPVGRGRRGDRVLRAQVTYDEGGTFEVEVGFGDIEVLPLAPGQEAVLDLRPRRRFDVGLGGPGKGGQARVRGGLAGLIIDARGRPLVTATEPADRLQEAAQWLLDVGG